eukprot:8065313-Lingulodinium_polyedra.AAC.1
MSASTVLSRESAPDMPIKAWNQSPLVNSMEKVRTLWPVDQCQRSPQHGAAQLPCEVEPPSPSTCERRHQW